MEDTVMGDLKMEATEPKDAADATSPPMKYYKGRFKHSEKAYFLFLCRKHGIPDLRPEGRKEQHHVREQYALALTAMQAEATKHIKGDRGGERETNQERTGKEGARDQGCKRAS
ncbi:hypothetical protein EYC80_005775 [Monilinia laxa]|uniref:Uncharacterized protein n=1 Tax=Monilinia laxa TaxID=61186 RepID=A0A5N6KF93_MONLA|nr:hypothetical protein EYC80_005775 [Monilinia laxa]